MWKESLSMITFDAGNGVGIQAIGAISNEFSLLDVRKWTDTDAQNDSSDSYHISDDISTYQGGYHPSMRDTLRISLWLLQGMGLDILPKGVGRHCRCSGV